MRKTKYTKKEAKSLYDYLVKSIKAVETIKWTQRTAKELKALACWRVHRDYIFRRYLQGGVK